MKKNRMMRVASALLVAVLLTTCAISGTFAKYVTDSEASDSARVAKWGVTIKTENFDLFTTDYETDDNTFSGQYSVSSENAAERDDVFAPGTSGEIANIELTGSPEVAVEVAVAATVSVSNNWIIDGEFYCPIVITVGTDEISGLDYESATDFADAINEKLVSKSAQYAPNTDLSTIDGANLDISWAWAFENATGEKYNQTNDKDTKLGNLAVAEDLKIEIGVDITVTQID